MPELASCPPTEVYRQLVSGKTPPPEAEPLLAHLESCGRCAKLIGGLSASDTIVDLLQKAATVAGSDPPVAVTQLIERLSRLRPGESAAGGTRTRAGVATQPPSKSSLERTRREYEFLAPPEAEGELGCLGTYRVLDVLGTGGMGVVFRALDPRLQRIVALKAMLPQVAARDGARERFLREARAAAALKHDHVVAIYDADEDRGVPYLAMEFLDGESLETRLARTGSLPLEEVLRIGRETSAGLDAAHRRGLIHRDIKPANIWLEGENGRVKILDFGLARGSSEGGRLTEEGAIVGTPAYMAPEQAQGREVGPRSDLFSLGCVLYEMSTGQLPFRGTDIISVLMAVSTATPPAPRTLNAAIPRALSDLIVTLLSKDPATRPASAQVVGDELDRIARQPPPRVPERKAPPSRRLSQYAIAGLVGCGLALVVAAGVFHLRTKNGTIVLEDVPQDAVVLVDGETAQITFGAEGKSIEVQAEPGTRKVVVKADGFQATGEDVLLAAGERKPVRIRMEPLKPEASNGGEPEPPATVAEDAAEKEDQRGSSRMATIIRGRWEKTEEGLIQHDTSRSFPLLLFGDTAWRDYDFSVDAMRIQGNDQFALYMRVNAPGSLYWFGAAEWGNTLLQLGSKSAGRDHILRKQPLRLKNNQWYTARVRVRGKHIECTLSEGATELHKFEVDNDRHPTGRVGLRTCCSAVRFRNIKVTAPDGTVLWEGPPDLPRMEP